MKRWKAYAALSTDRCSIPAGAQTEFALSISDYVASLVMPDLLSHSRRSSHRSRVHTVPEPVVEIADQLEDDALVAC